MEAIVKQRVETSREVLPPFTLPHSFLHRDWWNRSVPQETLAEIVLTAVTLAMVGGMLWGFFQALNQWHLG
jgi:hypothetical protein